MFAERGSEAHASRVVGCTIAGSKIVEIHATSGPQRVPTIAVAVLADG